MQLTNIAAEVKGQSYLPWHSSTPYFPSKNLHRSRLHLLRCVSFKVRCIDECVLCFDCKLELTSYTCTCSEATAGAFCDVISNERCTQTFACLEACAFAGTCRGVGSLQLPTRSSNTSTSAAERRTVVFDADVLRIITS